MAAFSPNVFSVPIILSISFTYYHGSYNGTKLTLCGNCNQSVFSLTDQQTEQQLPFSHISS